MGMIKQPRSLRGQAMLGAAAALFAAGAARAEEPAAAEPIIVTGHPADANPYADPQAPYRVVRSASPLFSEPLQDTPKGVTVLPAEAIHDLGATSFRDLFRTQPGVTLGTGEGGNAFGDRIFIRGFDARNDVYIDGVRDPGVGARETFAVQQVEILRGPSGAFGGRGTTGGAVSLVSKQPGAGDWGDLDVAIGSDETRRVTLDVNRQLSDDVALRVNAMNHDANVAGRDYVFNNRWGLAAALAYTPTDDLRIGFDYYHLTTDYLPDWGVPYDAANNRPFAVNRDNYYGVLARDFGATFADVATAALDWDLADNVRLHSALRYGQSGNAYTASAPEQPDAAAGTVRANAKRRDAITEYWTNQTNLSLDFDTGAVSHALIVGFELAREETLSRTRAFTECAVPPCTGAASNPTLDLYNPDPAIPWGSATEITGRPIITTETAAIFALDTIALAPRWQAMIGVRADRYAAETEGLTPARDSESDFVSWHAGLVYKPSEASTLYVSHGSSSNPPCEQLDAFALDYGGCDARVVTLDPVRNTTWELGAKITLLGHLDANAALFQIARDSVPIAIGFGPAATLGEQSQEVNGVEFTLAGDITPSWSVIGGLTLFNAEITQSDIAANIGADFPNISERSFTLTSRHQITDRIYLGATATYQSEKFGGTTAANITRVPEFWRGDLFGGIDLTENVSLSFNVLNVADELYYDALYRSATPFTYVGPGRSALVTLDIEF